MKITTKARLLAFLTSSSERVILAKGTVSSFLIQGGFAGLSFFLAAVLARLLGPEGYGAYANAIAWVGILGTVATFGFGSILVRDVAIKRSQHRWEELKGFLQYSDRFVLFFSIFLVLIVIVVGGVIFFSPDKEPMRLSLWIASLLIPLSALATLKQSATRGLEHITHSMVPDLIIRPILIGVGIWIIYYFLPGSINAPTTILISVGAAAITFGLSSFWLQSFLPLELNGVQPNYQARIWLGAAFPMLVYGGLQIIISQTSTVLLGIQSSAQNVGLFSVAYRLSYLLTFFLGAVHIVIGPVMARLNANCEKERLQKILTLTVRVSFLLTLLLSMVFLFAGDYILAIFGPEFIKARATLNILVLANLVDVASGSPSLLLAMTGREKIVAVVFILIALINVMLNGLLISLYGFEGAAVAYLISMLLSRSITAIYALKNLQLNTTIFFISKRDGLLG